ncbi:MAG: NADH-quinone oxidoreductase subunit J [Ignavibacterium album]|jgi:NADH-quinone oxidoreductase subunit J|uniref:NADH-quinone oxidoreductase subunit J family protein n=1 Tax=Ignavibacterium album TaxID=591197 RepID=UPI0026F0EC3E|nr:NADH-quinone oxidoreductase subunit J [Ignavibacterium album]MCX8106141.1 NADH-quinone oxidoreductase subunit J [Ignavibacterium album]
MSLEVILFFVFGFVAAVAAVLMITRTNPVIAALFLILNMASLAGLYLTLNAQFIAVAQVIVYAGAIMVLFLFVIMLLRPENEKKFLESNPKVKIFSFIVAGFVLLQLVYIIFFSAPSKILQKNLEASVKAGTIESIGNELFRNYVLPFEAAGFLLLAATIGAILLAKKKIE